MGWHLHRTVVLVGMMGAGKTSVGTGLAGRLGVAFRDSDAAIVEAANMSIAEIFARDGEAFFRAKESQLIARLLDAPPAILAVGGGAYQGRTNRCMIAARGAAALWLKADLAVLWQRVRHRRARPLLETDDPYATLEALYTERAPAYAEADLAVEAAPGVSPADTVEAALATLAARPDILRKAPE